MLHSARFDLAQLSADMSVVVRFAPSPTGFLHIGGARTALFNWLFARHHSGKFLLRIEDTDRVRSTPGAAATTIHDRVQGEGTVANTELDDLIILRADGTPTYNLSVVVDDHDMGITHVIRGDDHLNNAFRQKQIYDALGWALPEFAHVPLIHGEDGAKLSKRHGALAIDTYRDLGYLPEALRNYLLRLGWSHGDDEIISTEQAIEWFDIDAVGRAPARFDFAKLDNLNGHYIRAAEDERLVALIAPKLEKLVGKPLTDVELGRVREAMPELKLRPKTLAELAANARFLVAPRPIRLDEEAARLLTPDARRLLVD